MTTPITFGKTLDDHLRFISERDKGIEFLARKLPKGNERLELWHRVFNYEQEVGLESDAVQRVSQYWNGLGPELQLAMERKVMPLFGYKGDDLRMRFAYFLDRAAEELRDLNVKYEDLLERVFKAKSGAKAGLGFGVGISAYMLGSMAYEAATNPQLREALGKEPIRYAAAVTVMTLALLGYSILTGAFIGAAGKLVNDKISQSSYRG
ncbi:hypothetical protein HY638_05870 [Candidatus Woesearchaeota archaeon]|nr:hypothetical protein [Candidatus Woesearchaeota archaeon]